nr:protein TolR [Desulfobulbaceae bacterium]
MGPLRKNSKHQVISDINVTPFVDVMLVLLIIFMVTAPMMTQGVDVDLPETTSKALKQDDKPIVITINKTGDIYFNRIKGNRKLLKQQLLDVASDGGTDRSVFLKADKNVQYGLVVAVMADIKEAGFKKLGMITQPQDQR